jgi:hypothetical protein
VTEPRLGFPHVLIRRPFWVPVSAAASTVTFLTPSSPASPPKLPMLQHPIRPLIANHKQQCDELE